MNKLRQLEQLGQSVWLDFLSRDFLASSEFRAMLAEDGLSGMTSNPSIFEKAISHGTEYDADIKRCVADGCGIGTIFRHLSVRDIQTAADALRPAYDAAHGADGFISIEVSPYLAYDAEASIAEARALWHEISRPNLMVKIPGTREGIPAIRTLIGEGININITLLFALARYREVVEAYLSGLEILSKSKRLDSIASVASFFVSRIDSKVDAELEKLLAHAEDGAHEVLQSLLGKVAIANAKLAYQYYKQAFAGERWQKLSALGARPQRLLWASTSTKNKAYPDVLYVNALIGPDTVNTLPPETLRAFRDHGQVAATLDTGIDEARAQLDRLKTAHISLDQITDELVSEGVEKFSEAADALYAALALKRTKILDGQLVRYSAFLGNAAGAVEAELERWTQSGNVRRLWAGDKSLWTGTDEDRWLGWLRIAQQEAVNRVPLEELSRECEKAQLGQIVLLGMGGSSLGAEVIGDTFGHRPGWPHLTVLDSTDPDQIRAVERALSPEAAYFLVSSKSGTTLEPNILQDHFLDMVRNADPRGKAEKRFIAITDPGSTLDGSARRNGFLHVFHGDPAIGGRFSVLSNFGLVPAALMGLDIKRLLLEAGRMTQSCGALVPPCANPGVRLGVTLGILAREFGRDKITIVASPSVGSMGAWLEQLLAESTGKHGKGFIPVDTEMLGEAGCYGADRVFVHLHLAGEDDWNARLGALHEQGHPVVRMTIDDTYQIAQLFVVWEFAVAVAGAVLSINPFDQPDVEASKQRTRQLTETIERDGKLPAVRPDFAQDGIAIYADAALKDDLSRARTLADCLRLHLARIRDNNYFALLAFMLRSPQHESALQAIRLKVRDRKRIATCLGFGPRYLHSTGQAYKGGPNSGVFVTLTCDHSDEVPIANRKLTFGAVELAQAQGDFEVLNERGRRAIRVHLHDLSRGLEALGAAFEQALS
ncbi:MAG TPA: bifunctional transaldolase/phosoglucose isomerase [Rhizomicrobium sp.]|jgi:transaldolase/glucose-6-phosphate isomerase